MTFLNCCYILLCEVRVLVFKVANVTNPNPTGVAHSLLMKTKITFKRWWICLAVYPSTINHSTCNTIIKQSKMSRKTYQSPRLLMCWVKLVIHPWLLRKLSRLPRSEQLIQLLARAELLETCQFNSAHTHTELLNLQPLIAARKLRVLKGLKSLGAHLY